MIFEDKPLVCICVPNYNNEKTISETLDTLLHNAIDKIIGKLIQDDKYEN